MSILELVHNIALLLALIVAYDFLAGRFIESSFKYRILAGILFGGVVIVGMLTPFRFAPGIIYDGRSIVLCVAGGMGGPVIAAAAASISAGFRLWVGGAGTVTGILVILTASALGTWWYYLRRSNSKWEKDLYLLLLGVIVHAVMLSLQLLLPGIPGWRVVWSIGPTVMAVFPPATMLILKIFLGRRDQRNIQEELAESERRYRSLFENTFAPMLLINPDDGYILDANREASKYYGWSIAELCTMRISDINTLTSEEVRLEMEKARRFNKHYFEFRHRRKDGSVRDVAVFSGKTTIQGDERLYSIVQDITKQKETDAKLVELLEHKESLLREVHHRVKNNLSVINGLINLQVDELENDNAAGRELYKIRGRILVMGVIHNLLYHDKHISRVNFAKFLRHIVTRFQHQYTRQSPVKLSFNLSDTFIDVEKAVPLGLIVNEVISNAYSHAFKGLEEGTLSVSLVNDGAENCTLEVRDNGEGLPSQFCLEEQETLGFKLVHSLSQQIDADVSVRGEDGTAVEITFKNG